MKRPLVKICGITNIDDAYTCLNSGADMLGFIFYEKSPRNVLSGEVMSILKDLRKKFTFYAVGVFVNPEQEYVNQVIEITGIDFLQFHGDENLSFIKRFAKKGIKAFRIKGKADILRCYEYRDVDYFLFDTFSIDSYGGTGKVFDWTLLEDFKFRDRLFLSGGINSDNVVDAIGKIKPYAIDLSSSLESVPGKKDKVKIKEFFLKLNNSIS